MYNKISKTCRWYYLLLLLIISVTLFRLNWSIFPQFWSQSDAQWPPVCFEYIWTHGYLTSVLTIVGDSSSLKWRKDFSKCSVTCNSKNICKTFNEFSQNMSHDTCSRQVAAAVDVKVHPLITRKRLNTKCARRKPLLLERALEGNEGQTEVCQGGFWNMFGINHKGYAWKCVIIVFVIVGTVGHVFKGHTKLQCCLLNKQKVEINILKLLRGLLKVRELHSVSAAPLQSGIWAFMNKLHQIRIWYWYWSARSHL